MIQKLNFVTNCRFLKYLVIKTYCFFLIEIVFFVKVDLARERAADLAVLTEDEYQKVFIFYASFIQVCLVIVFSFKPSM